MALTPLAEMRRCQGCGLSVGANMGHAPPGWKQVLAHWYCDECAFEMGREWEEER